MEVNGDLMDDGNILDVHQAARYLKLNEYTIRRLAREKKIPAFKVGAVWRFLKGALDSWMHLQHVQQGRRRVLVVDDEEYVRYSVGRMLEKAGFEVRAAAGGEEALEAMRHDVPDLVLLDLKMPGMDGPEVLQEIRRDWNDIPVVILTGYPESELVSQALRYSPITLLTKDGPREMIVEAVRKRLASR